MSGVSAVSEAREKGSKPDTGPDTAPPVGSRVSRVRGGQRAPHRLRHRGGAPPPPPPSPWRWWPRSPVRPDLGVLERHDSLPGPPFELVVLELGGRRRWVWLLSESGAELAVCRVGAA